MSEIAVREAQPADYEWIVDLYEKYGMRNVPRDTPVAMEASQGRQLIGEYCGERAGALHVSGPWDIQLLSGLLVDPAFRGHGVGNALADTGEQIIRGRGYTQVEIQADDEPALNFWRKRGYTFRYQTTGLIKDLGIAAIHESAWTAQDTPELERPMLAQSFDLVHSRLQPIYDRWATVQSIYTWAETVGLPPRSAGIRAPNAARLLGTPWNPYITAKFDPTSVEYACWYGSPAFPTILAVETKLSDEERSESCQEKLVWGWLVRKHKDGRVTAHHPDSAYMQEPGTNEALLEVLLTSAIHLASNDL